MRSMNLAPSTRTLTLAIAAALAAVPAVYAQDSAIPPTTNPSPTQTASPTAPTATPGVTVQENTPNPKTSTTPDTAAPAEASATLTNQDGAKKKKQKTDKTDRVQQTKDTKAEVKKVDKYNALLGKDSNLPDKQLYDKALAQEKSGHYDIARLDLQTMLNTYPDSPYLMRAKLAVADCWYREGGTAALAQAEQEYKDFITFFPDAPEAAEAQMRVGDIYFKQMDVPDRDYTKALHAEEEYRTMLKQYPDAPKTIIDQATQKLREVQEMLATREALNAAFYATHENWPATIARYQTVVDQYPQYSHMDDALIGLGDTYEQEARIVRSQPTCVPNVPSPTPCLPEAAKAHLEQQFDGRAADAYRKVVLEHAAAPHVEDAKERLVGMNLPVPTPTPEQIAASETLEGSRAQYTMSKRLELLFLHKPDTVTAAQTGAPPLDDAAATVAPTIVKELQDAYVAAVNPNAGRPTLPAATDAQPTSDASGTPAAPPVTDAAPSLSDIPATGSGSSAGTPNTMTEAAPSSGATGNHLGVEVLTPGVSTGSGAASSLPAATGAPDKNYGLSTVAPKDSTPLPAAEKAADAPDQLNDVPAGQPAQTTGTNGKKNPPPVDKNDESSSKKKPKKGLDKINPF